MNALFLQWPSPLLTTRCSTSLAPRLAKRLFALGLDIGFDALPRAENRPGAVRIQQPLEASDSVSSDDCLCDPASDLSDEELASRVHKDPDAFFPLYHRYYDRILNYSYRRALDRETAQDLTSQTFLAAFEYLRRKPFSASSATFGFRAWLYRIATNARVSHWRKSARWLGNLLEIQRHYAAQVENPPSPIVEEDERVLLARKAISSLPEKYRLVIRLRYEEELPFEEIGKILNLAPGSVRSRISRALKMLRQRLELSKGGHGHE